MSYFAVKAILSGLLVAAISEIARRSPGFAALVASLPMFLLVPWLIRQEAGFWPALSLGCVVTVALSFVLQWLAPRFNLPL